jgi:hypothetical protein
MPCEESVIRLLRRFVEAVVLLLFTVGIVGIWRSYQGVSEKVQKISAGLTLCWTSA